MMERDRSPHRLLWASLAILLAVTTGPRLGLSQVQVKPGIRGGTTLMTIEDLPGESERRTGLSAGVLATIDMPGPFAIQPEVLYVQKGAAFSTVRFVSTAGGLVPVSVERTVEIDYLELPLLGKLRVPGLPLVTPTLAAGPTIGLNLRSDLDVTVKDRFGQEVDVSADAPAPGPRSVEVGALAGLGAEVDVGTVTLSVAGRYRLGLTDAFDDGGSGLDAGSNRGFSVTAAVLF